MSTYHELTLVDRRGSMPRSIESDGSLRRAAETRDVCNLMVVFRNNRCVRLAPFFERAHGWPAQS